VIHVFQEEQMYKKGVALAVLILVFASIFLSGLSLIYFFSVDKKISERIDMYTVSDSVLIQEQLFDLKVGDIFTRASATISPSSSREEFLGLFKKELDSSMNSAGTVPDTLSQLYSNLQVERVHISDDKLTFTVDVEFSNEKSDITILYKKSRTLEKIFK